jgi:hypothetical protein
MLSRDRIKLENLAEAITSIQDPQRALDFFYEQYEMLTGNDIVLLHDLCKGKLIDCARLANQDPNTMGGELAAMDDAMNGRR